MPGCNWRCSLARVVAAVDGAVAVEFVLLTPLLVMMVLGVVDFGGAYLRKIDHTGAAGAGARYAFQNGDDLAGIAARVQASLPTGSAASVTAAHVCLCDDGTSVSCSGSCAGGTREKYVRIEITENYAMVMVWPGIEDPLPLSEATQVRVE